MRNAAIGRAQLTLLFSSAQQHVIAGVASTRGIKNRRFEAAFHSRRDHFCDGLSV